MAHDFLNQLEHEHDEIQSLIDQIENTGLWDRQRREDLFFDLKQNLLPHMKGEERFFYPVLKDFKDSHWDSLEALEEHHAAKLLLNELDEMDITREEWAAKFAVFKKLINGHITSEEDAIFRDASKELSDNRLNEIFELYQKEKEKVKIAVR